MSNRILSGKLRWLPWLFGLSLLVNLGFFGGFLYHRYMMPPPPERLKHAELTLQLSAEQRAMLARIQDDIRNEARENFRMTRERHRELVVLLRKDEMDLPALERHLRATTEPQVAMQRDVILRMLAFRNALNPEQKVIFNEKMERPGFLLRLAGFSEPMWRGHGCHRRDNRLKDGGLKDSGPNDNELREKEPENTEVMPLPGPAPANL